ncbi:unnamed protein product [Owenia fusiformis]|uniref:Ubiquitin thioesterase OTU n=1 Tax=Owenia fusiformis TaxID=6347 RepID=A0A8J1XGC3_OWEFU|nr:unnamed protein product [Owenia fusiformis]
MAALSLRVRSKNGQSVLSGLTINSTVNDLQQKIAEVTSIPAATQKILSGFPPRPVMTDDGAKMLKNMMLRPGDTLIIEETKTEQVHNENQTPKPDLSDVLLNQYQEQVSTMNGILMRKVVPANNSCLFTSINFCLEQKGGDVDLSCAKAMRKLIAAKVASDPVTYNEGFLGRQNSKYCKWILNDDNWGGAIEISILSKQYSVEIDVVDTQSGRIDRFGEDQNYPRRILIVYDGIHYDPLVLDSMDDITPVETVFSCSNNAILAQATEMAAEAKSSRQFTDVQGFTIRCLICQTQLRGQNEAQAHASKTGHINFGEV